MEYWDLYDSERKPLGRTIARGSQLGEGEFYICCEVWVVNSKGQFLITKRHPNKKAGNLWEFIGGGTLSGETTLISAQRELYEETGISANADELTLLATFTHKNYFMDIYVIHKDIQLSDLVLQPDEVVDAKWADIADINKMIDNGEFVHSVGVRFEMYKDKIGFNIK